MRNIKQITDYGLHREKTSDLIGGDLFHTFLKPQYFDIPAVELKTTNKGVLSYGSLNNEKEYP